MRPDPRIRQNLDRLSTQLESAADNARMGCFTFTKSYIEPCFSSLADCCTSCLPHAKSAHRHHHRRHRNARRSEFPFAFYDYDDYDSDEDDGPSRGFLAWGTDELDRLLAGSGSSQPSSRNERMFYGAVGDPVSAGLRRKGTLPGRDSPDPTVIPSTSMFGFLSTFGFRGKGMRYKPSAANLQEHPQRGGGALDVAFAGTGKGRQRSGTGSSGGSQGDSLRSRGDLWPSEDEDDAVVIGDDAFPRSSDGESAEVVGLGISDDDSRHEDLLVEDTEEDRRRRRENQKRLAMQRGASSGSMEESKARSVHFPSSNSSSAPPTIIARSPAGSIRSQDGRGFHQRSLSPQGMLRKEKETDTSSDGRTTPRPQMRQVPAPSPIHPSSPVVPSLSDSDSTPRTPSKMETAAAEISVAEEVDNVNHDE